MARKVTPVSVKVMAAVAAVGEGQELNVSALCRDAGVSRKTFYKWVARFRAEGLEGLEERSRRPRHSPQRVSDGVEDAIVRVRKELDDACLDHGATTIQWHLRRDPHFERSVPSIATVHRVLVRHGLVVAQPDKRPKSSWKRFEAAAPNERWQIDAMEWVIATGVVHVFNIVDDHSRVVVRSRAVTNAVSEEAWITFGQAGERWGLPAKVLSDNGLCFSGKLRGFEVFFEEQLRDAGIVPSTGRPYHPQTTGKVERFQQTLKKWLRRQPLAPGLDELQGQLDMFCQIYNDQRPHQGIGRQVPAQRWRASPAARPADVPIEHPTFERTTTAIVDKLGKVQSGRFRIHLGAEWCGSHAIVRTDGRHATIFVNGHLVRSLELDPSRSYQPSGRKRGGPRKPRIQ
jgi:transposase InsO family protein